jgi:cyclopropane fatty-acyl-phospholipid synthase-like methyltransferase
MIKFIKSLFTFVCLMYQQYNYTFHELRMQLENQIVQIQIQYHKAFQIIWEAFLRGCDFKVMNTSINQCL